MKYEQTADELQQLKATKEHLQDDLVLTRDTPSKVNKINFWRSVWLGAVILISQEIALARGYSVVVV